MKILLLCAAAFLFVVKVGAATARPSWQGHKERIGQRILESLHSKMGLARQTTAVEEIMDFQCPASVLSALEGLYLATDGGDHWVNRSGWHMSPSNTQCCSWYGVVCQNVSGGVQVVGLHLADNNLTGPVPEQFAANSTLLQQSLTSLNLSSNRIRSLPENVGLLTQLVVLDVGLNYDSLNLPASLGNMTSLVFLRVGNSTQHPPYEGTSQVTVPDSLGNLQRLKYLDLNHNSLYGYFPTAIFQLSLLQVLDLSLGSVFVSYPGNDLSGLPDLMHLDLDYNFVQDLPESLGELHSLEYFSLQGAPGTYRGGVPETIGQLSRLSYLTVAQNYEFSGPMTDAIWNLTNLEYLDISYNGVAGSWPSTFEKHHRLHYLEMGDMMYGHLPEILGQLTNLEHFGIRTNQLTGPLPASLGNLTKLTFFNVAGNGLNGTIPDSYKSFLPHVKGYNCQMDSNDLACPIPSFVPANCMATCT